MSFTKWFIVFLALHFAALGLGGWLMGEGPSGFWYQKLQKAPWTPPGWVFGFAWTIIMICYSYFLAKLIALDASIKVWSLMGIALVLNIVWNFVFFNQHMILPGLIVLILLLGLIVYFFINYHQLQAARLFLFPYILWMIIAISLNGYIYLKN